MASNHDPQRLAPPWIPPATGRANRRRRVITVDRRRVLWTPAATTTALWLDAADASTVTTVSGNVSQWNDKSGNGRNVAQGTAGSRPAYTSAGLNGLNVITFDGTADQLFNTSAALQRNVNATTIWAVARPGSNTATLKIILQTLTPTPSTRSYLAYDASNGFAAGGRRLTADTFQATTATAYSSSAKILCAQFDYINATLTVFENGTQVATRSFQTAGNTPNDGGGLYIGSSNTPAAYWNGIIAEIIIVHFIPSQSLREQFEGYLAHEWGLAGSLHGGHPFLAFPPYL